MHREQTAYSTRRTRKFLYPIVSGNTAVAPQKRNAKTKSVATKRFSFSDIDVQPIVYQTNSLEMEAEELRDLGGLLVETVRGLTGNIEHWKFSKDNTLYDLIVRCTQRLKDRAGVDHIEIIKDDTSHRLMLKRYVSGRGKVYCISLKRIFALKGKHRTLFHILMSFVKSLPYGGMFNTADHMIDLLWDCLFEDYKHHTAKKSLPKDHPVSFFVRYESLFKNYIPKDLTSLLTKYNPRKPLHKKIKKLLLSASEIDFNTPYRLCIRNTEESMFEHSESFLLVDNEDSEFTQNYINMLNEYSNEHDILSAYQYTTAVRGEIEPFEHGIAHKLNRLDDFICELNELLRQL